MVLEVGVDLRPEGLRAPAPAPPPRPPPAAVPPVEGFLRSPPRDPALELELDDEELAGEEATGVFFMANRSLRALCELAVLCLASSTCSCRSNGIPRLCVCLFVCVSGSIVVMGAEYETRRQRPQWW